MLKKNKFKFLFLTVPIVTLTSAVSCAQNEKIENLYKEIDISQLNSVFHDALDAHSES
ncbi:hypothetical protein [[Mycoplasma] collis]|uniref:hypothetical protein n=1 Tax=[Mycoplasma] collis TaxID=2127 RepID=UPI000A617CBF|nr:hypothetical protein [[Mycoplasma] collis]